MALRFSRNASPSKLQGAKPQGAKPLGRRPANYSSRATQFRLAAVVFAILAVIVMLDRLIVRDHAPKPAQKQTSGASAKKSEKPDSPSESGVQGKNTRQPESAASRAYRTGWAEVYDALREDEKSLVFRVFGFKRRFQSLPKTLVDAWRETHSHLAAAWDSYLTRARQAVESKADLSPDEQTVWRDVIEQAASRSRAVLEKTREPPAPTPANAADLKALEEAQSLLDDLALSEVRDDTVYRHAEKEIWFRLIEKLRGSGDADRTATTVDYIPLQRQSEQYRGRLVRVRGRIELAYRVAAPINDLGVKAYYIFWLRPTTGAAKPIIVYALRLPEGLAWRESDKQSAAPRAEIECEGYFFKRLAYRSGKGIDTAPLVVAAQPIVVSDDLAAAASDSPPASLGALAGIVLAAAVLATAATLFVFQKTRSAKRRATPDKIALVVWLCFGSILTTNLLAQSEPHQREAFDRLPWEAPVEAAGDRAESLREAFIGIDDAKLGAIRDGEPVSASDREVLLQVIYRLPRIGSDRLDRRIEERQTPALSDLASSGRDHRLEPFSFVGRVTSFVRRALTSEEAERFEFDHFYEARIELEDSGESILVAARRAPIQWRAKSVLAERVAVRGVFLKIAEASGAAEPLFAAERIEWLPSDVDPSLSVEPSHVLLGALGMDIGLFDDVRTENGRGIGARDSDCFRSLLVAVGRANDAQLTKAAEPNLDIGELLRHPESAHGRLYALRFKARRITRVLAGDSAGDDAAESSSPTYYQIDGFLPLGDQVVQLDPPSKDPPSKNQSSKHRSGAESPTFRNYFPATICVREIPEGLLQPNESTRELNETLLADAFFFKLWTYRSSYISMFDPAGQQPSPLFLGRAARVAPPSAPPKRYLGAVAAGAFVLAIAALWIGSRFVARGDRRHAAELRRHFGSEAIGPIGPPIKPGESSERASGPSV